jgi:predicted nucleic acid-binding protein
VVDALLDTSVVVDVLRGYPAAVGWFATQTQLGVPRATILEVLDGAIDSAHQRNALRLLRRLTFVEQSEEGLITATSMLTRYSLSHGVDAFDCMVAATGIRLALPIYTRNLKHFRPMIGTLAAAPY